MAALLAEVVELAGKSAIYPGRWSQIAELALGHESVRRALEADENQDVNPESGHPTVPSHHTLPPVLPIRGAEPGVEVADEP